MKHISKKVLYSFFLSIGFVVPTVSFSMNESSMEESITGKKRKRGHSGKEESIKNDRPHKKRKLDDISREQSQPTQDENVLQSNNPGIFGRLKNGISALRNTPGNVVSKVRQINQTARTTRTSVSTIFEWLNVLEVFKKEVEKKYKNVSSAEILFKPGVVSIIITLASNTLSARIVCGNIFVSNNAICMVAPSILVPSIALGTAVGGTMLLLEGIKFAKESIKRLEEIHNDQNK